MTAPSRIPAWLRVPRPAGDSRVATAIALRETGLSTVCTEANCPNRDSCWSRGTATFLVLGRACTRDCAFCSVGVGSPVPPDPAEPCRLARAAAEMRLAHVVVTMVTRDDLPDGGASHLAGCVRAVREEVPGAGVEVLASDLGGDTRAVATVMDSFPDVFGHNLETVERLSPAMRPAASYARSLGILRYASARAGGTVVKSGLMAGLGEEPSELFRAMRDLRDAGVGILTVGQYLTPAPGRAPVSRFLEPSEFEEIAAAALGLGFAAVVSSPLARSSLNAREALARARGAGHARG